MDADFFHALSGENIAFSTLAPADAEAMHRYTSDPVAKRFIGWSLMETFEQTQAHVAELLRREAAGTHLYASIVWQKTGEHVGTAMIFSFDHASKNAELGYVLNRAHWGRGIGTEAVALICGFAFETLKLHRLSARVIRENVPSARVLEKNGFVLEGCQKENCLIEGRYCDTLLYGRVEERNL